MHKFNEYDFLIIGQYNQKNKTFKFEIEVNPEINQIEYNNFFAILKKECAKERSLNDIEDMISAMLMHETENIKIIGKILHTAVDNAWIDHFLEISLQEPKRRRKK